MKPETKFSRGPVPARGWHYRLVNDPRAWRGPFEREQEAFAAAARERHAIEASVRALADASAPLAGLSAFMGD